MGVILGVYTMRWGLRNSQCFIIRYDPCDYPYDHPCDNTLCRPTTVLDTVMDTEVIIETIQSGRHWVLTLYPNDGRLVQDTIITASQPIGQRSD